MTYVPVACAYSPALSKLSLSSFSSNELGTTSNSVCCEIVGELQQSNCCNNSFRRGEFDASTMRQSGWLGGGDVDAEVAPVSEDDTNRDRASMSPDDLLPQHNFVIFLFLFLFVFLRRLVRAIHCALGEMPAAAEIHQQMTRDDLDLRVLVLLV